MSDHDPCLYCRIPVADVSGCGIKTKHCHRQEFIDQVCNMISSAAWEPGLEHNAAVVHGEIVDAAIVRAFRQPDALLIVDEAGPTEPEMYWHGHKGLRTEGDEHVCSTCGKRWDVNDPDVPECV